LQKLVLRWRDLFGERLSEQGLIRSHGYERNASQDPYPGLLKESIK
jgi:hypothetical protein